MKSFKTLKVIKVGDEWVESFNRIIWGANDINHNYTLTSNPLKALNIKDCEWTPEFILQWFQEQAIGAVVETYILSIELINEKAVGVELFNLSH